MKLALFVDSYHANRCFWQEEERETKDRDLTTDAIFKDEIHSCKKVYHNVLREKA